MIKDLSLTGARGVIESPSTHSLPKDLLNIMIHGQLYPVRIIHQKDTMMRFEFIDLTREQRDHLIGFLYTGRFDNAPKEHSLKKFSYNLLRRAFGKHDHMYS